MKTSRAFVVEVEGDLLDHDPVWFETLYDALEYIGRTYPEPDPEDDRILVWEMLPSGHSKVVWHFSGWHYNSEYANLDGIVVPQGKLLGDTESLYEKVIKDDGSW